MRRKSVPEKNPISMIILVVILLCAAGFAGFYFGVLKKTYLTAIEVSHPLPMGFSKSRQLTAFGRYSDYSTRDVTNRIIWRSSDMDVASISNADGTRGLVVSRNTGKTNITAT
ncbi:MAG: Ig-like domain-containing protein, partial [Deltaproteobacteria bacterium]|nr:Ig-like domain-containing protein [Deltaproteobacteria bacterium]